MSPGSIWYWLAWHKEIKCSSLEWAKYSGFWCTWKKCPGDFSASVKNLHFLCSKVEEHFVWLYRIFDSRMSYITGISLQFVHILCAVWLVRHAEKKNKDNVSFMKWWPEKQVRTMENCNESSLSKSCALPEFAQRILLHEWIFTTFCCLRFEYPGHRASTIWTSVPVHIGTGRSVLISKAKKEWNWAKQWTYIIGTDSAFWSGGPSGV